MSVRLRKYRGTSAWEVDIVVRCPNGEVIRERRKAPFSSKEAAKRWGEQRAVHVFQHGKEKARDQRLVPTLAEFAPVFIDKYARGNQEKPSSIKAKESILALYVLPELGRRRLDALAQSDVQQLKARLRKKSRKKSQIHVLDSSLPMLAKKTVNNVLVTLSGLLKAAVAEGHLPAMPVKLVLHKPEKKEMSFYDVDEYVRLVAAAADIHWRAQAMVLLGGDAGLRCGEILGLQWSDIDFRLNRLTVRRSRWQGEVTTPKNGHVRTVSLTRRLSELLRAHRGVGDHEVLCRDDGNGATRSTVSSWMRVAQTAAGLKRTGGLHVLRHTFCSQLALAGVPVLTIKELAGHRHLATTERYMHLRQVNKDEAVALLEQAAQRTEGRNVRAGDGAPGASASGEILEKAGAPLGSPD